jgi:hypothetical protein
MPTAVVVETITEAEPYNEPDVARTLAEPLPEAGAVYSPNESTVPTPETIDQVNVGCSAIGALN